MDDLDKQYDEARQRLHAATTQAEVDEARAEMVRIERAISDAWARALGC